MELAANTKTAPTFQPDLGHEHGAAARNNSSLCSPEVSRREARTAGGSGCDSAAVARLLGDLGCNSR